MRAAVSLVLTLACLAAGAAEPAPAVAAFPARRPSLPRLGLALDAGLPGGAGVTLQARVLSGLRVGAGPMYSGVGYGVKGGLQLSPAWVFAPALELEGGWAPRADLSLLAGKGSVAKNLKPVLAHASYWFASALVGFDLGSPRGLSFMLRGGLSHLDVHAGGTATVPGSGSTSTVELGNATVRATIPCAKLGLQYWF
jgi:hypothetical protein